MNSGANIETATSSSSAMWAQKRMVINVEAKAAERFGDLIGEYFDRKAGSGSKVPARIRQL
jgi:hypothetical protein